MKHATALNTAQLMLILAYFDFKGYITLGTK
jgi:hypothetical protein